MNRCRYSLRLGGLCEVDGASVVKEKPQGWRRCRIRRGPRLRLRQPLDSTRSFKIDADRAGLERDLEHSGLRRNIHNDVTLQSGGWGFNSLERVDSKNLQCSYGVTDDVLAKDCFYLLRRLSCHPSILSSGHPGVQAEARTRQLLRPPAVKAARSRLRRHWAAVRGHCPSRNIEISTVATEGPMSAEWPVPSVLALPGVTVTPERRSGRLAQQRPCPTCRIVQTNPGSVSETTLVTSPRGGASQFVCVLSRCCPKKRGTLPGPVALERGYG